ncbi:MAG: type I 3-dehydroquinate dehydratase [Candidatus Hermodarchaeota archaeon]
MNPNICITIPIKTNQFDKISASIKRALNEKPEFIELRFDFIKNIEELTSELIINLKKMCHPTACSIFTFRNYLEGGNIQISEGKRFSIIESLINAKPNYIDVELQSNFTQLNQILSNAKKNDVKIIVSYHDLKKTPSYKDALDLIETLKMEFINKCLSNLEDSEDIIYKFVFTVQNFEDNIIPLKICNYFREKNQKVISFCMGEMGIFSRVLCPLVGSFLTYVSLDEKVAPGQINIKTIKELFNLLINNL